MISLNITKTRVFKQYQMMYCTLGISIVFASLKSTSKKCFNNLEASYHRRLCYIYILVCWFMVFNATFNNMSVISLRSVLLVEETRVPTENHRYIYRITRPSKVDSLESQIMGSLYQQEIQTDKQDTSNKKTDLANTVELFCLPVFCLTWVYQIKVITKKKQKNKKNKQTNEKCVVYTNLYIHCFYLIVSDCL